MDFVLLLLYVLGIYQLAYIADAIWWAVVDAAIADADERILTRMAGE